MKKVYILLLLVGVIVILSLILLQQRRDVKPFNKTDFPSTLVINNNTEHRADTICLHLLQRLGVDTADIIIVYIPKQVNDGEMEFYGIVQHIPFKKNQFVILLNKELNMSKLKETLSHEFVHIEQYISGDLVMYPKYAIYKGEDVYFGEVLYWNRSFEKEALKEQGDVIKELNKLLYK